MTLYQTPLYDSAVAVYDFMKRYNIVRISLLQKSREIVGVSCVSCKDKRTELLNADLNQLYLLENILCNSITNIKYSSKLLHHQKMLEYVNIATAKYNVTIDSDTYYSIIRNTLFKLLPEFKYYLLLKYDVDSHFYRPSVLLSDNGQKIKIKVFIKMILNN